MIDTSDATFLAAVVIGVLGILAFALGLLAILEVRALSRPRRRRSTWI